MRCRAARGWCRRGSRHASAGRRRRRAGGAWLAFAARGILPGRPVRTRAIPRGSGIVLLPLLVAGCGGVVESAGVPPSGDDGAAKASIDASLPFDAAAFDATSASDISALEAAAGDAAPSDASVDARGCRPRTCLELGYTCGINADGCGGAVSCGTCTAPALCGGGGFSKCGVPLADSSCTPPPCTPLTCQAAGFDCGPISDGCGGMLNCGSCQAPDFCGGGGFSVCGHPTALDGGVGPCAAQTCAEQNIQCGLAGDGCGLLISCGSCTTTKSCGGGGVPSQCGSGGTCARATCARLGNECGFASDGCDGVLDCGGCGTGARCIRGKCRGPALGPDGGPTCVPQLCAESPASCGPTGDGCGGVIECSVGAILPTPCGCLAAPPALTTSCSPLTCGQTGVACGPAGDGCGNVLDCGLCSPPEVCGGGGPSKCG
jgi:hypothetical protein